MSLNVACSTIYNKKMTDSSRSSVNNIYNHKYSYKTPRWPEESLPLVIEAPKSLKNLIEPSLKNACDSWNRAIGRKVLSYVFEEYDYRWENKVNMEDNRRRLYFIRDWGSFSPDASYLGYTVGMYHKTLLIESDIGINLNYDMYYSGTIGSLRKEQTDFGSLLLHEIGHLLGAGHIDNERSVMFPYIPDGMKREIPTELDEELMFEKYN